MTAENVSPPVAPPSLAPWLSRLLRRVPPTERTQASVIVATIVLGLALDQAVEIWGQVAVSVWTWLVFLWLLDNARGNERRTLLAMLMISTVAEIFFSLGWGLYVYRLKNVPAFVPPGHVLLFVLGNLVAARATVTGMKALALASGVYALLANAFGIDELSIWMWPALALALTFAPARRLYAAMFVLALAMELYGTWLGNWTWMREVPLAGLTTTNPPGCVGAGYCLLDLAVLGAVRAAHSCAGFLRLRSLTSPADTP